MKQLNKLKYFLSFIFLSLTLTSCSKENDFIAIEVKIINKNNSSDSDSTYVYLTKGLNYNRTDSIPLSSDSFIFKIKRNSYEDLRTVLIGKQNRINRSIVFLAGTNNVEIVINDNKEELPVYVVHSEGKEQLAFSEFKSNLHPILVERDKLSEEWYNFVQTGNHLDSELRKPFDEKSMANRKKHVDFIKNYVSNHSNLTTLYLLNTELSFSYTVQELSEILNRYSEKYHKASLFLASKEKVDIMKNVAIGAIAPDFTKPDVNGDLVSLSDYRGGYVLLDFWASWCGPCRAENPHVVKAYNQFKNQGFDVLGVSYDFPGNREEWLKAIEDDKLPWTQVSDLLGWKDPTSKMYNISGIPSPFLIDPNGKIVAKGNDLRGESLIEKLHEIFD